MYAPDYHVHTRHSDGVGEVAQYVERAIELGMPQLGIADHIAPTALMCDSRYGVNAMPHSHLQSYVNDVRAVSARYRDIRVLLGCEVDYMSEAHEELEAILSRFEFDYVLGAVHYLHRLAPPTSAHATISSKNSEAVLRAYYRRISELASSGLATAVSHLDFPKRYGYPSAPVVPDEENAAITAIGRAGIAVELNTGGWRHPPRQLFPTVRFLQGFGTAGIAVILGSDAHDPKNVGYRFPDALAVARRVGLLGASELPEPLRPAVDSEGSRDSGAVGESTTGGA